MPENRVSHSSRRPSKRQWIRLYTDLIHHPKILRLTDRLFRLWVLVILSCSDDNGVLTPLEDLAITLRMSPRVLADGLASLCERRLIDATESGYVVHNWASKQYESDSSTARVQAYRERFRNVSHVEPQTVTETPPDTDTESDTDTDTEKTAKRRSMLAEIADWFHREFWPVYPRKVAKEAALKAAKRSKFLSTSDGRAFALNALRVQLPDLRSREVSKIPHAATWINGERWNDEPDLPFTPAPLPVAAPIDYSKLRFPTPPPMREVDERLLNGTAA